MDTATMPTTRAEFLSVDDAAVVLGVSRNLIYTMMADGRLRSIKIGRRRLIARAALDELIAQAAA